MDDELKRLKYRSWHRGCKETDVILGNFADAKLERLEPMFLAAYEKLLDEDDADIWHWLVNDDAPAEYAPLLAMMKHGTE